MKTRPSQQNGTILRGLTQPLNQFFTNVLSKDAFRMLFSLVSQVLLLLCRITWSSFSTCKSCHCWGPNIFRPNSRKKCEKFKSVRFLSFTKKTGSGITHNVYKTVWLSEELLVYSYTIWAVWADDGDRPLLLLRNWGTIFFLRRDGRSLGAFKVAGPGRVLELKLKLKRL
jgi:hypothetical protein